MNVLCAGHVVTGLLAPGRLVFFRPIRIEPIPDRIVEPHLNTFFANRIGQIAHQITRWARVHRVPWHAEALGSLFARPQAIAIMMLRSQHHILGTTALKDFRPLSRLKHVGSEL